MDWGVAGGLVLGLALLTVVAGPAAASHEEPTKVFETTVGDAPTPTTGYHVDEEGDRPVDATRTLGTFEIQERFSYWYATATEIHIQVAEVDVNKVLSVETPDGEDWFVDNAPGGWGERVELCPPPAVSCTHHPWDGEDHWALHGMETEEGTYEVELFGTTTAEYTVAVFGFESPR